MSNTSSQTRTEVIANTLIEEIIGGELKPLEKLRQDHIAQRFNASHVPVREALLKLVATGLAVSEQRKGVRVAPIDNEELRETVEMRAALETLALKHAAPRMRPIHIQKAELAMNHCDMATTVSERERYNRAFHYALVAPCAMPRLLATIENLQLIAARHFHIKWRDNWTKGIDRDHHRIMQHLKSGDFEGAQKELARHLKRLS
ncbi:GntR family transcriptional regulator [Polycladidibacter stylochi]|uniref:GntR family transcriptional regulator n=1 Tax=Polycladidibacter stylochi TaxID=1807766 RepID=UPI0008338441|nr:GntR family transcriptional regulator [Pseudovibrio stylochi]